MSADDVERIARSVITQYGLSLKVLRVSPSERAWAVVVKPRNGATIHLGISAGSAHDVRRSVIAALQVEP